MVKLLELINKTLDVLYDKEAYIFQNDTSEKNMVFHFSRYFIDMLKDINYNDLSVDCEYNKNALSEHKYKEIIYNYDKKSHKIYPDLILHKRGSNDSNILAIEFKKHTNHSRKAIEKDSLKLKALTSEQGEFKYKIGLFITLGKTRERVKIKKYINGKEVIESKNKLNNQKIKCKC